MSSTNYSLTDHIRFTYDILDSMVDWVRVVDKKGEVIFTNKSMMKGMSKFRLDAPCHIAMGKDCPCRVCITRASIENGEVTEKEELIEGRIFSVKSAPVRNPDGEIYAAVEVFRDITREKKLEKELITTNKKMKNDLDFSRKLQQKILPKKGICGNFEIDYLYEASEALSGDMFDVYKIDDRYTGIYVSDVVGHGVTASMMTMFIRQTMRGIQDYYINPNKVIKELHRRFLQLQLDDDKYFTIFYGILNNIDNTFTYVNGGHNCIPFLVSQNKVELLKTSGFPISSLFNKVDYEECTVKIEEGDYLILYTDGILEAKSRVGEQFGMDRLRDIVRLNSTNPIESIKKYVKDYNYNTSMDDLAIIKAAFVKVDQDKFFLG
jgi:sigma-B regulation protein RsbU (phosphoserine phosphatase)